MHCGVEQVDPHHVGPSYLENLSLFLDLLPGEQLVNIAAVTITISAIYFFI